MAFTSPILLFAASALSATQASPAPRIPAAGAAKPANKLKCVSTEVTGSLARRVRECHTPEEWERLRFRTQEDAAKVIDNRVNSCGASTPGGC